MNAPAAGPVNRIDLLARFQEVRAQSEHLCAPLAVDDYQVQSALEASPPKWHLAHVSWFFETFLLKPFAPGYRAFHPRFEYLFNSYYETVGAFHPRAQRGLISRPTVDEIYRYRAHVDAAMLALMHSISEQRWEGFAFRVTLGLHHEQQHQELLLMDIKHNFAANPMRPAYQENAVATGTITPLRWIGREGGVTEIGHDGRGFAFDNETPRHTLLLRDHALASRPVTNSEYLEFIESGGYDDPRCWLADGWAMVRDKGWRAPLYWEKQDERWWQMTLAGLRPLNAAEPVCHVSFYEADAYARWADKRLPLEEELETMLAEQTMGGNFVESGLLHPRPAQSADDGQWYGNVWEWTRSAYSPYPGFKPLPGSLGEYNGKFMANQLVLRGGCCVTPESHIRASYRNFFYPHDRWPFAGIRLAADC